MPVPSGGGNDDESDDDENESSQPQNFFAGGERSGISIEGPARGGNNLVKDILRKAAQGGQAPVAAARGESSHSSSFGGGGHTLGSTDVPSSFIGDPSRPAQDDGESNEETAVRHITFWRDGFSVEDGPLLRYDVPENSRLLNEINTGHAPPSILNVRVGQPVELRVARRTNEEYVPPPKRAMAAFEGSGNRLGSPVPVISGAGDLNASASVSDAIPGAFPRATSTSTDAAVPRAPNDAPMFEVDQTAPTTSIQVRLADGTRLVARMNMTHTVGDIRNFINASRPGQSTIAYTIGTTFPNRTLEDDTVTIESGGLKNSVIVQRLV